MPYYNGVNMRDTVRALPEPPEEEWLLDVLHWLTEALAVIHAEHCYHRDIAPDNVMMLADTGRPLLLDFGAARRVIGDMTRALAVRPEQRTPDVHALRAELGLAPATVPAAGSGVSQAGSGSVTGTPTLRSGGRTHSGMARPVTTNRPPTTGAPTAGVTPSGR